ncbi:MAG: preprotein translocase subunit SecG [Flavobacteriales bacterium]|nr:preprotein translocase subunit SecG [Flavobacteriales bacterium]
MALFITVLIIITCVLLVIIVLIQNPKGGGLSSEFSSSNQYLGVRKTADFLEKATWTLAIVLLSLSLMSNFTQPDGEVIQESVIQEQIDEMPAPPPPLGSSAPLPGTTK